MHPEDEKHIDKGSGGGFQEDEDQSQDTPPREEETSKDQSRQQNPQRDQPDVEHAPPWEEVGRGTRKIPKGAAEVLQHYFDAHQIEMAGEYHSFFSSWKDLAGIDLAAHSKPRDIRNEVLIVEADHPGWMQMITMKKREILREVRRRFPQIKIRDVRVVLYSGPQRSAEDELKNEPSASPEAASSRKDKTSGSREKDPAEPQGNKDRVLGSPSRKTQSLPRETVSNDKEPEESGVDSKDSQKKRLEEALKKLGQQLSSLPKNGDK